MSNETIRGEELHVPGTSHMSRAGARYVRAAKTNGGKVFVAIDSFPDGKNCTTISNMVNFVELIKEGSRELGLVLLAGYIACATTYSSSINNVIDDDLADAMEIVLRNLTVNQEAFDRYRQEIEYNQELVRELTRRDANKPKE